MLSHVPRFSLHHCLSLHSCTVIVWLWSTLVKVWSCTWQLNLVTLFTLVLDKTWPACIISGKPLIGYCLPSIKSIITIILAATSPLFMERKSRYDISQDQANLASNCISVAHVIGYSMLPVNCQPTMGLPLNSSPNGIPPWTESEVQPSWVVNLGHLNYM